ncbi:uncharacterized protein V1513DRAFT_414864 [Lipomyces chichibuensis]|uniref:uncharacterized protein n=1 Tax=Lipomyces chichibuensis TaxID=1546026 RepID=UPI0033432511
MSGPGPIPNQHGPPSANPSVAAAVQVANRQQQQPQLYHYPYAPFQSSPQGLGPMPTMTLGGSLYPPQQPQHGPTPQQQQQQHHQQANMFAMPPFAGQQHLGAQAVQQTQPQLHHPQLHHQQQPPTSQQQGQPGGQPLHHQPQPPLHADPMGFPDQFGARYDTKRPHPPPPPLHQQTQQPQHHMQQAQQSQQQHHLQQTPQQQQQQQQQQQPQQQPPTTQQQQHLQVPQPPSHAPTSPSFSFDSLDHEDLSAVGSASPATGHVAKKQKQNPPLMNGQPLPQQQQQQPQQQQQQQPQTQAKRPASRATTWTKVEEERLRVLVECGTKWQAITKEFPNRTAGAIKKHYYADMKHTTWNPEEDSKLTEAVKEDEDQKWKRVAEKVGKPAKACEKRIKELMKLQQPGSAQ